MFTEGMKTSATPEWETPQEFFDKLDEEFHFDLDPCATDENHKCAAYFTKDLDGLKQSWGGRRVFCNPPYGREIKKWVKKSAEEAEKPDTLVVMLIPARTDTEWFHDYIYGKTEIRFIKGRMRFSGATINAPFPSMIVIFGDQDETDRCR